MWPESPSATTGKPNRPPVEASKYHFWKKSQSFTTDLSPLQFEFSHPLHKGPIKLVYACKSVTVSELTLAPSYTRTHSLPSYTLSLPSATLSMVTDPTALVTEETSLTPVTEETSLTPVAEETSLTPAAPPARGLVHQQ